MCLPPVCAGDLSGRGNSSCRGVWVFWLERGSGISVWHLLIFGIVSGIAFCLEGLQPGSLYCTETAVVGDVGTSCSPSVFELSFCFDCCVPCSGRSRLMKAIFLALEAYGFIFYSALLLS